MSRNRFNGVPPGEVPLIGEGPGTPPIFPLSMHAVDPQFPVETHFIAYPFQGRDKEGNAIHGFHTHAIGGLTKLEWVSTHIYAGSDVITPEEAVSAARRLIAACRIDNPASDTSDV